MTQEYTPVSWQDETTSQQGTLINAERLNQMQTAHHYADGFEEVDTAPTADPGVGYHKVVYCTADSTFYRWDGTQWQKDIDDDTKALLLAHEADHANPHQVTKAQVGLGNADNTSDADKPVSTATQTALDGKADKSDTYTKAQVDTALGGKVDKQDSSAGMIAYTAEEGTEGSTAIKTLAVADTIPIRTADGRLRAYFDDADPYADDLVTYAWTSGQLGDIRGTLDYKADKSDTYTKAEIDTVMATKADKATTLAGYGITDAYTKTEADTLLAAKADQATTYTKTETDTLLGAKANDNAVVKLTGDQTIQGVKTFYSTAFTHLDIQSSKASGNLGGIYYKNGSGVVKEQINGTAEGNLNLYPDSTQGGAVKVIGQRAYNASYTTDVATIATLDAYTPMVRTTGTQTISGDKTINNVIIGETFDNKNTVTQFDNDTSKYCKLYTYNTASGAQYKTFMVIITPKRVNINRTGILYFGDNRNTSPVIGWLIKGSDIPNTDFVITKESDGTITVWCKTYTGNSDGYHGIRLLEHTTSNLSSGYLHSVINEAGYAITSSGYTDSQGVVHTFTHYVTPS